MLVLCSACELRRRLGALRNQADGKQVYVRRRRRLKGLKAAQTEAHNWYHLSKGQGN